MKATEKTALNKPELTASQKLELMQKQLSELTEGFNAMVEANQTIAIQMGSMALALDGEIKRNNTLRAELGALIDIVSEGGSISRAEVKERVIQAGVASMKARLDDLIAKGLMVATDEVAADSLIVAQQVDREGNIVDRRLQVLLSSLEPETQLKILSKKAGETVDLGEDDPLLYILEIYKDVSEQVAAPAEQ